MASPWNRPDGLRRPTLAAPDAPDAREAKDGKRKRKRRAAELALRQLRGLPARAPGSLGVPEPTPVPRPRVIPLGDGVSDPSARSVVGDFWEEICLFVFLFTFWWVTWIPLTTEPTKKLHKKATYS